MFSGLLTISISQAPNQATDEAIYSEKENNYGDHDIQVENGPQVPLYFTSNGSPSLTVVTAYSLCSSTK